MNFEKLNQIFMTSVNLAVLVSVVLLIFELKQNQEIAIAQTRNDISSQAREQQFFLASNDIADLVVLIRSGEKLSDSEQIRFDAYMRAVFNLWENIAYQHEKGLYSEEEMKPIILGLSRMSAELWEHYWSNPNGYAESFQTIMNEARILRDDDT